MGIDINAHHSAIVRTAPVPQILAIPDLDCGTLCKIERLGIVGEYKFCGVEGICEGKIVPQPCIFYVFLGWEDNVVALICNYDIQWVLDVARMMVTAPVTVECTIGVTAHTPAAVDKLHCSHKLSIVA